MLPFLGYLSEQAVAANRSPPLPKLLAAWRRMGAPEYLPAGTLMPAGPTNLPAIASVDRFNPLASDPDCRVQADPQNPAPRFFRTISPSPCRIRLTVYFYPFWRASDESGRPLATRRDANGLLIIDLPPGDHLVSVDFLPESPARTGGAILSVIALLASSVWLLLDRRRSANQPLTQVPAEVP
jgi:hypothetical protein